MSVTDWGIWPSEDLEWLGQCPVCGSVARSVLLDELHDNVFRSAPGAWTLVRCEQCENAYLDPRPTEESIGRAYQSYYTHEPAVPRPGAPVGAGYRYWLRALANGYRSWRYGAVMTPAWQIGKLFFTICVPFKRTVDREFRYLSMGAHGRKVLDVGFGSGRFLDDAQLAGWVTFGVDPDPVTVASARRRGHHVKVGGIESIPDHEKFDAITLSHVIEHVHDPVDTLRRVFRHLEPGGMLWLDTPNIDSNGRKLFGRCWRGVEAPRHLTIFSWTSAERLLIELGFVNIKRRPSHRSAPFMFLSSIELRRGVLPPKIAQIFIRLSVTLLSALYVPSSEFVTLTATKPKVPSES